MASKTVWNEHSLPTSNESIRQTLSGKFDGLQRFIRICKREFPTEFPVTVFKRNLLFCNFIKNEISYDYRMEFHADWRRIFGQCDFNKHTERFEIIVAYHPDFGFMADTFFHEYAHAMAWRYYKNRKEHPLEYFEAYGRVYQRCIDNDK
jgi:hypothetical protein